MLKIRSSRFLKENRIKPFDSSSRFNHNILPISSNPSRAVGSSSRSIQETISKWASYQVQEKDKPKQSFNKLPVDYKRMLLLESGEVQVVLENLNDEAINLFTLSNSKSARSHLNSLLESEKVRRSVHLQWPTIFS